jgi:hypothetical protein
MSNARNLANLLGTGTQVTTADIADGVFQANKNLIINGAMQVAQRGTSVASSSGSVVRCVDRYRCFARGAGAATFSQTSTVPTGQGFANSLRVDVTTVDSSLDSNDLYLIDQRLEGQDLQQLAKGTSDAKSITASFWVRSTKTGTYILELFDDDNTRNISKTYTISSADTWEYKTVTFEGDTTGALDNDNNTSFTLRWFLGAGTSYTSGTLATAWEANNDADRAVGQVNFFDSTGNDFYLTGVQLEVGEQATPFEHRSYGDELVRCQRYYQSIDYYHDYGSTSSAGNVFYYTNFSFPVTMRATPTMTASQWGQNTGNASTRYTATEVNGWIMQSAIPTGCLMRGNHANIYNLMRGRGKFDAEL